ncbi:VOC family protein [Microbacterium ulmi]|uniref:Glyoxalase n=1 Tax=Microbacterium ulmi TaxID=179095 RepID=A0A7Y2M2P3_9MICO|nr:VOC family protein [Microbacterium ulmi]NII70534.1 hypothetical protein [Microbacterium ulmi]NNH05212.1 glyoxalase [Microbacterium ulmi]
MRGTLHHLELWVSDLGLARREWGWLLGRLGCRQAGEWPEGTSWSLGSAYLTITLSPNLHGEEHDRRMPGVNHIAVHAGSPAELDELMTDAAEHGWSPLYHERYPHAGGPDHYAGWLESRAGFKVELVAD